MGVYNSNIFSGNLNIGAGHYLTAPAGINGVFNTTGHIFFVDGFTGSNGNSGTDPANPFLTITYALTQCVNNRDDYIFVLDCWNADAGAIAVNKNRVHIIGIGNGLAPAPMLAATGDTNIFTVPGDYCEIAGFCLGGGASSAGIECSGALNLWVHNCEFGNADNGDTPAYGILCTQGTVNAYMLIENCVFLGSGGTSQGKISGDGIRAIGTNICRSTIIRNNIFGQIPGIAINMTNMYGGFILNNQIALDANTSGAGITLSGSTGCLIDGNHASYGKTDATAPFVDSGVANCWVLNYKGIAVFQPA